MNGLFINVINVICGWWHIINKHKKYLLLWIIYIEKIVTNFGMRESKYQISKTLLFKSWNEYFLCNNIIRNINIHNQNDSKINVNI